MSVLREIWYRAFRELCMKLMDAVGFKRSNILHGLFLVCVWTRWSKRATLAWVCLQRYKIIAWITVLPAYLGHLVMEAFPNYTFGMDSFPNYALGRTWGKLTLPFGDDAKATVTESG